jgi:hypothetical protein
LTAKIARLCILREDLLIEMHGVLTNDISALDDHSAEYRRMYFLRNLLRTHMELSGAVRTLLRSADFKALLERQPEVIRSAFAERVATLVRVHPILKDVRNDICGHVLESAVQSALERIPVDSFGFLDIGPIAKLTHFKFVGELVAEILLKGVSPEDRRNLVSSRFGELAEVLPTFSIIEYCLVIYAMDRKLLPVRPLS